jgi:ribose-phosphate pyrophosphokinase
MVEAFVWNMKNFIFVCPKYVDQERSVFAEEFGAASGHDIIYCDVSHFADGETKISFPDKEKMHGRNVVVIRHFSFSSRYSLNHQLFNFLFVAGMLKECGAQTVTALMPYVAYARHDESEFSKGIGAIGSLASLFKSAGVDFLIACDLHEPKIVSKVSLPLREIKLDNFWIDIIKSKVGTLSNFVIASPDTGGSGRAESIAREFGVSHALVQKERYAPDRTRALKLKGDVKDKDVILVDDIIDTATTATNAADMIMRNGAKSVIGCFSHGVLSGNAISLIEKSCFKNVFIANVLRSDIKSSKIEQLSIADFVAKNIKVV